MMRFQIAVEDMEPEHWIAWVLDMPGCYSSAKSADEALEQVPACIQRYFAWIAEIEGPAAVPPEPVEFDVVETFESFPSPEAPDYIVNAFFEADRRPLSYWDILTADRLLDLSRKSLWQTLEGISKSQFNQKIEDEVTGSIAGIVRHIYSAENWYLSKLDMALDRRQLTRDILNDLEQVRHNTKRQLWSLIGDSRIVKEYDESWSARKVIRRALWHERDHTQHIEKLIAQR